MSQLAHEIDAFRRMTLKVYQIDRSRLARDINAVVETVKDHLGRWPLELIQNCADAHAKNIHFSFTDDAIYVADDGDGLTPRAIESLSGTHGPTKPVGTIGRKGLGFKAVYDVTTEPYIFTGEDDGVVYSENKARAALQELNLTSDERQRVPYEWLPFWVSRREAADHDQVLHSLNSWKTVVRLPFNHRHSVDQALSVMEDLPSYVLLPFQCLRKIHIDADRVKRTISCSPDETTSCSPDEATWNVTDTDQQQPMRWSVRKPARKKVPDDKLQGLEKRDRERMEDVSLLVAAPIDGQRITNPMDHYPTVCVYYATQEHAPLRLLLHADFLVESDRKHVLSPEKSPFNKWMIECLAEEIVAFVQDRYVPDNPSAFLRLLLPHETLPDESLGKVLWNHVVPTAKMRLLLPDAQRKQRLSLDDPGGAFFIASNVDRVTARRILEVDRRYNCLVHESIENDTEARMVASALGAAGIDDRQIVDVIARCAAGTPVNRDWLWDCWLWLGQRLHQSGRPDSDVYRKYLNEIINLPILPVSGRCGSVQEFGQEAVLTWDAEETRNMPKWMPLRCVDAWFSERFLGLAEDQSIRTLLKALGIKPPDAELFLRAFGKAIENYWSTSSGDPERFLDFLLERDWHNGPPPPKEVQRCPIPIFPGDNLYDEARRTYFGRAWGNNLLADFYEDVNEVTWALKPDHPNDDFEAVLRWLGVATHPRVVNEPDQPELKSHELNRIQQHVSGNSHVKRQLIKPAQVLEHVKIDACHDAKAILLLRLIVGLWEDYYRRKIELQVECEGPCGGYRASVTVPTRWWSDLKTSLVPPLYAGHASEKPLQQCWLPDRDILQSVGEFLPVVNLEAFGDDGSRIEEWLRTVVGLRSQIRQIRLEEWREILGVTLPNDVSQSNDKQSPKAIRLYEAALDSLKAQDAPRDALRNISLRCRQGNIFTFVCADEYRWLEDETEIADAFRDDLYLMSFGEGFHSQAQKYFGLKSLKDSIQEDRQFPSANSTLESAHAKTLLAVIRFVYAWRRYRSKDAQSLHATLSTLRVILHPTLQVQFTLGNLQKTVSMPFAVENNMLLLCSENDDEVNVARALARALGLQGSGSSNFLENLLRCHDDNDRKNRLKAENIPDNQIDQYLDEFSRGFHRDAPPEMIPSKPDVPPGKPEPKHSPIGPPPTKKPKESIDGNEERTDIRVILKPIDAPTEFRLEPPPRRSGGGNGGGSGDGGSTMDAQTKKAIEMRALEFVGNKLKSLRYAVEEMPFENEGYDLRATREGEVLLVEVKGHRGASLIAEITPSQVELSESCQSSNICEKWQLWNVEFLSDGIESPVTFSIVETVPRSALKANTYRLDLRQCHFVVPQ